MFGFFKKKEKAAQQATAAVPVVSTGQSSGGIAFYPNLIEDFIGVHHRLFHLHGQILAAFLQQDLVEVATKLNEFGALLRNHLLTENMRLYIYLQQKTAGDEVNSKLVRAFRKEMDGIAKTALDFLAKYEGIERNTGVPQSSFIEEFTRIGDVLGARTRREEETLYPLYVESYT